VPRLSVPEDQGTVKAAEGDRSTPVSPALRDRAPHRATVPPEATTPAAQMMVSASSLPCSSSTPWASQDITHDEVMTSTPFLTSVRRT
jgi:hypothetical protein